MGSALLLVLIGIILLGYVTPRDVAPVLLQSNDHSEVLDLMNEEVVLTLYKRYLNQFEKSLRRLTDIKRITKFIDSLMTVYLHNSQNALGTRFLQQQQQEEQKEQKQQDEQEEQEQQNKQWQQDSWGYISKPLYRLQVNQFSDMYDDEIANMFTLSPRNLNTTVHPGDTDIKSNQRNDRHLSLTSILSGTDVDTIWGIIFGTESSTGTEDTVGGSNNVESGSSTVRLSLNWATDNNPYGTRLTTAIYNQGSCGACWAFVSVSTTEAMVKMSLLKEWQRKKDAEDAAGGSKSSEKTDSSIGSKWQVKVPSLSAQQLIDCDHTFNKGCNGGNPYYAMRYITEHGVRAADGYPFQSEIGECQETPYNEAHWNHYYLTRVVEITSYNDEAIMNALQSGPVSVGLCGTDKNFLYYSSGIYNDLNCCDTQNHAFLIVGYGYDNVLNAPYWIAQNSWGLFWGERGFMRILRGSNKVAGICGINVEPAQGSGGYIVATGDGQSTDPQSQLEESLSRRFYRWLDDFELWFMVNWQTIGIVVGSALMLVSFSMLIYGFYLDRQVTKERERRSRLRRQQAAKQAPRRQDYQSIPSTDYGNDIELARSSNKTPAKVPPSLDEERRPILQSTS